MRPNPPGICICINHGGFAAGDRGSSVIFYIDSAESSEPLKGPHAISLCTLPSLHKWKLPLTARDSLSQLRIWKRHCSNIINIIMRETTNRKRFWETDMRKPATKFPILCNNNFHPAPGACCSSGIVNFNFSLASRLLISPVIHHNTAGRQHQHHQGPTFEVKHTKSKAPFLSQMRHVEHMSPRYMDNLKHLRLCATACQNVDPCVTAENRRK